jgi:predicted GNAT family N-acyltransferase
MRTVVFHSDNSRAPSVDAYSIAPLQSDLMDIFRLRYKVYIVEQGKSGGIIDENERAFFDFLDFSGCTHILIRDRLNVPVAAARVHGRVPENMSSVLGFQGGDEKIVQPEEAVYISRLVLDERFRSSWVFYLILSALVKVCADLCPRLIVLNCSEKYIEFYKRLGFQCYASPFYYGGVGVQYPMRLVVDGNGFGKVVRGVVEKTRVSNFAVRGYD